MFRTVKIAILGLSLGLSGAACANELEILNIRLGQGDATLIQGPVDANGERVNVLFDAGDMKGRDGGDIIRAVLARLGIRELDYLIISHDDADHLGGVGFGGHHGHSFLLGFDDAPGSPGDDDGDGDADWLGPREFFLPDPEELGTGDDLIVRNFVDYGAELMRDDTQAIEKYQGMANAMGTRITLNSQADVDSFEIDLGSGARMILFAANGFVRGRSARVDNVDTPNERSLSFLVTYGNFDFLISGDMTGQASGAENAEVEFAVGQAIVAAGFDVDVLHANHHGADNASETRFLELIRPEIAIVSAGNRNSHEHPRNAALERMVTAGVDRIFQTEWGTTESPISLDVRDHHAVWQQDI
ncbi:ComEC/Rec2 family competence protein, partial [Parasphingopyxis lamellibrachiae]